MAKDLPHQVDTVIVGSGPSALILSFILHGNIPVYNKNSPHPDPVLHEKLKNYNDILSVDIDYLTEHFHDARFSYSTQALPINVLFDTLNRPFGETDEAERKTCLDWRHDPSRAVQHIVVGNTPYAGGQWVDNPVEASWDIGTLSYAGMLSLPGYSFEEYYKKKYNKTLPFYSRPPRCDITNYFRHYPELVGIDDTLYNGFNLTGISRSGSGFHISSHGITCKHLVLASGTFTKLIPPRPLLLPLSNLSPQIPSPYPILVVGSGFSAADVIISTPPEQKIIHIYKWAPNTSPSPLRACHQQAYPEYAGVYRKMKLAAVAARKSRERRPSMARSTSIQFDSSRDWDLSYEGLPNTVITSVRSHGDSATVTLQSGDNEPFERTISRLDYVVGRRGSLAYLEPSLRHEACADVEAAECLTGQTMREKAMDDLEVAKNVFIIGNLTGDSLIRFAYGGCVYVAGKLMRDKALNGTSPRLKQTSTAASSRCCTPRISAMNGLDGHARIPAKPFDLNGLANTTVENPCPPTGPNQICNGSTIQNDAAR